MELPLILFFTVNGGGHNNPSSAAVIRKLMTEKPSSQIEFRIFDSLEEADAEKKSSNAVAVCDGYCRNEFTPVRTNVKAVPAWATASPYVVTVTAKANVKRCANQIFAAFVKRAPIEKARGNMPWGPPVDPEVRAAARVRRKEKLRMQGKAWPRRSSSFVRSASVQPKTVGTAPNA